MNDLQVLSGWLQLGRTQAAKEYLSRVQARLAADSQWSLIGDPDIEAVLFLCRSHAEGLGLGFSVKVIGAPDPAYVLDAAATAEPNPAAHHGAFPIALLALLRSLIDSVARSRETDITGIEGVVYLVGGRPEFRLRVPGASEQLCRSLVGLEDQILKEAGFAPEAGPEAPGGAAPEAGLRAPGRPAVAVEWRAARRDDGASRTADQGPAGALGGGASHAAEGRPVGMELVVLAEGPRSFSGPRPSSGPG